MRTVLPALLALLAAAPPPAAAQQGAKRPNAVLIIADDLTWRDLPLYGSEQVRTPHIDALAGSGLRFDRAFQTAPMCSPTRHNLYTGLYPVRSGAYPNHTFVRDGVKSIFTYLKQDGYRVALAGKEHVAPRASFPYEHLGNRGAVGNLDMGRIEGFVRESGADPFLLVVASNEPHTPWDLGDPNRFDPARVTLPSIYVDTPETREAFASYLAEVEFLDRQVGEVMRILDRTGAAANTLVLFTSEQGNSFPFAKWTLYDRGLRTALVARWPGRIRPGRTTDAMVEYTDVVPTLLEATGAPVPAGLDGRSFLGVLTGAADRHRDHTFGIHTTRGITGGTASYGIRSVRSERFKYIRNLTPDSTFRNATTSGNGAHAFWKSWVRQARTDPDAAAKVRRYQQRPGEELYDVLADPEELRNLAGDPRYQAQLQELRQRLDRWMADQGDQGQATEMRALDRQPPARARRGDAN